MTKDEMYELIKQVDAQRPRRVLDHILKHGQVSTEELREVYGYQHEPRAARDVREWGIPLKTIRVRGKNNRMIGAYVLGDPKDAVAYKIGGRVVPPKTVKEKLVQACGERCNLCNAAYPVSDLQVDHRIPYEIGGETGAAEDIYQLVCASCNRKKSWSCEHCPNWQTKDPKVCATCRWASPHKYDHIATVRSRSVTITWGDGDIAMFEELERRAQAAKKPIDEYVKELLEGR
jgi:hypothetical protein